MTEQASMPQVGPIIRGYHLNRMLSSEMATTLYAAYTEELWLPSEILIRLLPLPDTFSMRSRTLFHKRFEWETKRLIRLRHPSLFPLFGAGHEDGMPYLLMPCARGETLAARLQRHKCWTFAEACELLTPLASALDMLHQEGLICQFLHPAWIFLIDNQPPLIGNLRLAQMVTQQHLDLPSEHISRVPSHLRALDGSPLGAPEYLAPEVIRGLAPDARSDIYTLGVLLFELLSGQPPFTGSDYLAVARKHLLETPPALRELVPELPAALEIIVNRALHRDPRARFQSAGEMAVECSNLLSRCARVASFSLMTSLLAQEQALPALEFELEPRYLQPPVPTLPSPVPPPAKEAAPSLPEERIAEAWLNDSLDSATSETPPLPLSTLILPERSAETPAPLQVPEPLPASTWQFASEQTSDPVTEPELYLYKERKVL